MSLTQCDDSVYFSREMPNSIPDQSADDLGHLIPGPTFAGGLQRKWVSCDNVANDITDPVQPRRRERQPVQSRDAGQDRSPSSS